MRHQVLADGTYTNQYDAEGNLTRRTETVTGLRIMGQVSIQRYPTLYFSSKEDPNPQAVVHQTS